MEDDILRKLTSDEPCYLMKKKLDRGLILMEDNLQWKMTFHGGKTLMLHFTFSLTTATTTLNVTFHYTLQANKWLKLGY